MRLSLITCITLFRSSFVCVRCVGMCGRDRDREHISIIRTSNKQLNSITVKLCGYSDGAATETQRLRIEMTHIDRCSIVRAARNEENIELTCEHMHVHFDECIQQRHNQVLRRMIGINRGH